MPISRTHDSDAPRRARLSSAALVFTSALTFAALPALTLEVSPALAQTSANMSTGTTPIGTTPAGTTPALGADKTKPVTTDNVLDEESTNGNWRAKPFAVTLVARDAAGTGEMSSGVATIEFRILRADGSVGDTGQYVDEQTAVVLSDGDRVQYRAIDKAGNKEAWKTSDPAKIDTHAPTVSASTVPTAWQNKAVEVTLTDTDQSEFSGAGGSGVAKRFVKLIGAGSDADGFTEYDATDLPTLANGQRLQYYAVDRVGNVGGVKTTAVAKVDLVDPVVELDPSEVSDLVQSGPLTVTMSGSDALSGFGSGSYAVYRGDGAEPVRTGTWVDGDAVRLGDAERLVVVLTDRAGNETEASTTAASVDGLAPTTSDDVPETGWVTAAPFTATLTSSDTPPAGDTVNGSTGVKATYFQVQRPDHSPYTDPIAYDDAHAPVLGAGERVTYYSVDNAGNLERSHVSATVRVDGVKPTTMASAVPAAAQKAPVEVTLTAEDTGGSGVDTTYYRVVTDRRYRGVLDQAYDPAHKPVLSDGQSLEYWTVDVAGNVEDHHRTATAKVDLTAPTTSFESDAAFDEWSGAPIEITLGATDPVAVGETTSGVDAIKYRVVNGATHSDLKTYDASHKPTLGNGDSLEFHAVDKAGNAEETQQTDTARVDTVAPAVSFRSDTPSGAWAHAPVTVTPTFDDPASGVDYAEFQIVPKGLTPGITWTRLGRLATKTLGDGETLRVRAVDVVGNTSAPASYGPVKIDVAAPVTTAAVTQATATYLATVTLTATDERSGVAATNYVVLASDGSPVTATQTYDDARRPTLADGQSLRYWSVDVAGNAETAKTTSPATVVAKAPTPTPVVVVATPTPSPSPVVTATPTPAPAPVVSAPVADFGRDADASRVVLKGRTVPVNVTCAAAPCRVKITVQFVTRGKTVVTLATQTVLAPANTATAVALATTRAQRSKIRQLVGKTGAGGEVRTTLTVVDAAGKPIGAPIVTRRGLRTAVTVS